MKPKFSLIPARVMIMIAEGFTVGEEFHNECTPEKSAEEYLDAAQRHIWAFLNGETVDSDSKLDHRIAAINSLIMNIEKSENKPGHRIPMTQEQFDEMVRNQ